MTSRAHVDWFAWMAHPFWSEAGTAYRAIHDEFVRTIAEVATESILADLDLSAMDRAALGLPPDPEERLDRLIDAAFPRPVPGPADPHPLLSTMLDELAQHDAAQVWNREYVARTRIEIDKLGTPEQIAAALAAAPPVAECFRCGAATTFESNLGEACTVAGCAGKFIAT